jgi:serine/threonine-protein kinase RsbW
MTGPALDGESPPGLELELPAKPVYVRTARHAVGALARLHDLPDDLVEDIKLAVSEACTTAVAAAEGLEDGADAPVHVIVSAEQGRVIIDVADPRGRAPREVSGSPAEIDTEDLPFDRLLSLPIIRGLVDEVAITSQPAGGIRMRMVVSLPES